MEAFIAFRGLLIQLVVIYLLVDAVEDSYYYSTT